MDEERKTETMEHVYKMRESHLHNLDTLYQGIKSTKDRKKRDQAVMVYKKMLEELEVFEAMAKIPKYKRTDIKKLRDRISLWNNRNTENSRK